MKKFSKILAIIFVVMLTALSMVACAPSKNPEKALQSLKNNGYEAGMLTKETQTLPMFSYSFDNIVKKIVGTNASDEDKKTLLAVVSGSKLSEGETVTILYFDSKDAMEKRWNNAKIYLEEDTNKDLVVERSGKIIYIGTEAAIKAARG